MAARWWPPALRFAPYGELGDTPNVVVDGSAKASTVLTLSHWPHAPCPDGLRRDLSAESALAYLDAPSLHDAAEVVTNNHFDQDGLMSAYALTEPEAARDRADLVTEVARAGDFAVTTSRDAARISMAIAACASADRSPLDADLYDGTYDDICARLYVALLPRLTEWIDDPDSCHDLWAAEDAQLETDMALMASAQVGIEEVPELDLTVVTLPATSGSTGGHRFGGMWSDLVHPMALHAAIDGFAVLLVRGDRIELRYRYESWVQYQTRAVRPRVDLSAVADELTALESGPAQWLFDGPGALTPALRVTGDGATSLDLAVVRARIEQALRTRPPAWDPYEVGSSTTG
jgi:hypothetical protein